jgi:hypothetical protein
MVERILKFSGMLPNGVPDDSCAAARTADARGQEYGAPDREDHTQRIGDVNGDRVVNTRRRHHHQRADDEARQTPAKKWELPGLPDERVVHGLFEVSAQDVPG